MIYSPERVFIYIYFRKEGLRIELFTKGKKLENVIPFQNYPKWGGFSIYTLEELEKYKPDLKHSFELLKEAISSKETLYHYQSKKGDEIKENEEND